MTNERESERACANESGQIEKLLDRGGNRETESRTRFSRFKRFVMRLIGPPRPPVCNYRTFILRVVSSRRENATREVIISFNRAV